MDPDCEQQKITLAFFKLTGPKPDHFGLKIRVSVVQIRPRAPLFQAPENIVFSGVFGLGKWIHTICTRLRPERAAYGGKAERSYGRLLCLLLARSGLNAGLI